MFDLKGIMQKAKNMQANVKAAQEELRDMTFVGDVSEGLVKITINGVKEVLSVQIDEGMLKEGTQMLEDVLAATFNDALKKCSEVAKKKMSDATGNLGIGIPDGLV